MNRDSLKDLLKDVEGSDALIDKIMAENGKDIEREKGKTTSLQTELDTAKTQLAEANKAIEDFKGLDVEGIKKAADDYKAKFEAAEAANKDEIDKLKFSYAFSFILSIRLTKNTLRRSIPNMLSECVFSQFLLVPQL